MHLLIKNIATIFYCLIFSLCLSIVKPVHAEQSTIISDDTESDKIAIGTSSEGYKLNVPPRTLDKFNIFLSQVKQRKACNNINIIANRFLQNIPRRNIYYSFDDIAIYYYGLSAHICGDYVNARRLYEEYLDRRGSDKAHASFPSFVFSNQDIILIRKLGVDLQEIVSKNWENNRWAFHFFKPDQLGYEYQNVLSNLAQLYYINTDKEEFNSLNYIKYSELSGYDNDVEYNNNALVDIAKFWLLIIGKKVDGNYDNLTIASLKESTSNYPISHDLLTNIQNPPLIIFNLRVKALLTLIMIIVLSILLLLILSKRAKKRQDENPTDKYNKYLIHKGDPLMRLLIDKLNFRGIDFLLFSILVLAFGQSLLALSEGTYFRSSFIVDRNFLDYYSFPFGFGLLIPVFFSTSIFFYRYIPKQLKELFVNGILSKTEGHDDLDDMPVIHGICMKYRKVFNSKVPSLIISCLVILFVISQKIQWLNDGGTAFVDLRYPEYISLTGIYFTLTSLFVFYVILNILFRGGATLILLARLFSKKNLEQDKIEPNFIIEHPDRCCGSRPLGVILVLFYFLLILIGAQITLNFAEKFNFYESFDIVLDQTKVSVVGFGFVFFLICPAIIASPLISIHLSMRRFRFKLLEELSGKIIKQKMEIDQQITSNTLEEIYIFALDYYKLKWENLKSMPLWPVDMKTIGYFAISNILPVTTFSAPFLLRSLGINV